MIEITYLQMTIFITAVWILVRLIIAVKDKRFSIKRELLLLTVYICFIVIARFVYFPLHHINGKIDTLKIGLEQNLFASVTLKAFTFITDIYDGSLINVIGNILMFVPVGIFYPICFKKLDNLLKTVIACFGLSLYIELTQLLCFERHTDVDDLILNTSGALIGAAIVFLIRRIKIKKNADK